MRNSLVVKGLDTLRQQTSGEPAICVAVLDGPVDLTHPCFVGARLDEIETVVANAAGHDIATSHGTHVASVIFGQPGTEITGISPGCRGLIVPVLAAGESLGCSQLELARAIELACDHGAHVMNISAGELTDHGIPDVILQAALQRCAREGVLIVAAAGNNGCACLHIPAAVASVLAVGAMDAQGRPLSCSNWGEAYRSHGLLAAGQDILGAALGGGSTVRTGTSFAAAVVSGAAALLLSLQLRHGNEPDPLKVQAALLASAEPCDPEEGADCSRFLAGRIDVSAAAARLGIGGAAVRRTRPSESTQLPPEGDPNDKEEKMFEQTQLEESMAPEETFDEICLSTPESAAEVLVAPSEVQPSCSGGGAPSEIEPACSCGGKGPSCSCGAKKGKKVATVYALGTVGYDFGSEARRDSLTQEIGKNVSNPREFLEAMRVDPSLAAAVTWTLSLETTVIYAIQPVGAFATTVYDRLQEFLQAQLSEGAERVSIPGRVRGSARLLNGQVVPRIVPEARGMYDWSTPSLVRTVLGEPPSESDAGAKYAEESSAISNFLDRIYYELRNLGVSPQDRALNFAATNAFQAGLVFSTAVKAGLQLDRIDVERSPTCRPGADCWDVKLVFFNPARRLEQARRVYRYTVDVSDVVPVTVGPLRSWDVY